MVRATIEGNPEYAKGMGYGAFNIDKTISEIQPDVYIGAQDIWGLDYSIDKPWFSKVSSVIWTTLDSLPLLPSAVAAASKIKNYWLWSSFATEEMHKLGHKHVKTVHGPVEDAEFFRMDDEDRSRLREFHNVDKDAFIVGFVFRNQLRKSVPNLLEGFRMFQNEHPRVKSKLLLHTDFNEGWKVLSLADEYKVAHSDILTTYICRACKGYDVKPFSGHQTSCRHCDAKDSQVTTNPTLGVTEEQLNEVYNLMDVYCHPFTSGGQEIPIQEAKLAELVTLITNYSCGEEMCQEEACSLPLEWAEYREHGTEFKKASTYPSSIAKQLKRVLELPETKRRDMGKRARAWAVKNYSPKNVCKDIEGFLDDCPFIDKDELPKQEKSGEPEFAFIKHLSDDDAGRRILFVMPESSGDVFWCTALFESIKGMYPDYNIYFATNPKFADILEGNSYIHRVLEYSREMDNLLQMEGFGIHKGYFEIAFLPHIGTQRMLNYIHNGKDTIAYDIKSDKFHYS